jgi:hypothetical protein
VSLTYETFRAAQKEALEETQQIIKEDWPQKTGEGG